MRLFRLMEMLAVAAFVVMLLATFLQVVFRYALPFPLMWTEELARLMAVVVTYFGAVVVWMLRGHIRVEVVVERLPTGAQRLLAVVVDVLLVWFMASFAYGSYLMTRATWGTYTASMPWFRMGYLYLAVGVAAVLLTGLVLKDLVDNARRLGRSGDDPATRGGDAGEGGDPR